MKRAVSFYCSKISVLVFSTPSLGFRAVYISVVKEQIISVTSKLIFTWPRAPALHHRQSGHVTFQSCIPCFYTYNIFVYITDKIDSRHYRCDIMWTVLQRWHDFPKHISKLWQFPGNVRSHCLLERPQLQWNWIFVLMQQGTLNHLFANLYIHLYFIYWFIFLLFCLSSTCPHSHKNPNI